MKKLIIVLTLFSFNSASWANSEFPTFLCKSSQPAGAVFLKLDLANKKSIARQSNPFTSDFDVLKGENPDRKEYTSLYIENVARTTTVGGMPACSNCYIFNLSVYPLPKNEGIGAAVNSASKSTISLIADPVSGRVAPTLKLYVDADRKIIMPCEKLE